VRIDILLQYEGNQSSHSTVVADKSLASYCSKISILTYRRVVADKVLASLLQYEANDLSATTLLCED
jgi:hypothetical protein